MFIILGTTPKGETFAIAHTTSRKRAEQFVAENPTGNHGEFAYTEMHVSHNLPNKK